MIHIYCGDGKGKTTASIGLAVRCGGYGKKVLFMQFLKGSYTYPPMMPELLFSQHQRKWTRTKSAR